MPNSNAPTGLTPRRYRNGSPWMGACRRYFHEAADATALFVGDPVIISGSGDSDGTPSCTRATAGGGGRITGVVVGFDPAPAVNAAGFGAASTAFYVLVADDPELLFEVQEDGVGGNLTAANIGQNIDLIAAAGNTFTKQSGFMIDSSTAAVTATLQMRIVQFEQRADNAIGDGATAKWLVSINLPTETGAAGALGV